MCPARCPTLTAFNLPEPDFGMSAMTPAIVAFVPHTNIRWLMAGSASLTIALWREALITAAIHRAWITGLGRRDARERLAHLFCELYLRLKAAGHADGYTMPLPISQVQLADALGQTSVHVNRMLQVMRHERLIILQDKRLQILDWPALCGGSRVRFRLFASRQVDLIVVFSRQRASPSVSMGPARRRPQRRAGLMRLQLAPFAVRADSHLPERSAAVRFSPFSLILKPE